MSETKEVKKVVGTDLSIIRSRETRKIEMTIPEKMTLREVADWVVKKDKEEDKEVAVRHEFDCFPLDGAVALRRVLDEIYGFVANVNTPTWFGPQPPLMIGVPVSADEMVQIPWGRVEIPGVYGYLETGLMTKPYPRFVLAGATKQRHMPEIDDIVARLRRQLAESSIYKGKAVRLDLSWMREPNGKFDPTAHAPKFSIDTSKVREEELIFPANVENDVRLGLFVPIEFSQFCRENKIPLKRGVLLAGEYGCGKTLCAYVTAKKAVDNGWTFVYGSDVRDMATASRIAAYYAPAVVFFEDIDRVIGHERTSDGDAILNTFDGVDTKGKELITVLTTNHVDRLSQALLRPGRCDTLVQVTRPDAEAAVRLVQLYGRGLLDPSADLRAVGEALADHLPAEIREATERAKLAAVHRLKRSDIGGHVMGEDILAAVSAMAAQHAMLQPLAEDKRGVAEKCADALGARVADAVADGISRNAMIGVSILQRLIPGADASKLYDAAGYLSSDDDVKAKDKAALLNGEGDDD